MCLLHSLLSEKSSGMNGGHPGGRDRILAALPIRSWLSVHSTLEEAALRSRLALLVLVDPHAVRHIRRRAENHMITRFQSRTNVDASAIV